MSSGVFRPAPQPQQPRRHAYPASITTVTLATLTGSITPAGGVTPSRAVLLATLTGSITAAGTTVPARVVTLAAQTGTITAAGALGPKTVTRQLTSAAAPSGSLTVTKLPAAGTWLAPTRALTDAPVFGSILSWTQDVPLGAHLYVETSIDNAATWDLATSGEPIPRLVTGQRVVRAVMVRARFTRRIGADPAPTLRNLWVNIDQNQTRRETIPLGVFVITDTRVHEDAGGLRIDIEASDLSIKVSDHGWEEVKTFPKDTNLGTVVQQIIQDRYPGAQFDLESTSAAALATLTVGASAGNDPFADAAAVARKAGMDLYVNYAGVFTMRSPPDPDVDPIVWTFSDRDQPSIVELTRELSRTGSANRIVVEGESINGAAPVRAVIDDNDPTSPNNVDGPEGVKVFRLIVKGVDANQAVVMARAEALKRKGALETVGLSVPPVPHLEEGDIVGIDRSVAGLSGRYLLDSFDIPFEADALQTLEARRRALDESSAGGNVGGLDGETGTGGSGGGGGGSVPRTYATPGECHKIGTNGSLNWFKLQTAFTGDSAITEKSVAQIGAGYAKSPEYCMSTDSTAVQMRINLNAPTTSGSTNPRTEYREVQTNGTSLASWDPSSGTHWAQATFRFTKLANVNQSCSGMQIHDGSDDVLQVLTAKVGGVLKIGYRVNGGSVQVLDDYTVGNWITVRIQMAGSTISIWYHTGTDPTFSGAANATPSATHSGGCYFKIGTYSQSTSSESSSDYAAGEFKKLGLSHPGYPAPVFDSDTISSGGGTATSFTFAFGACINAADSGALSSIAAKDPDWFAMLGDCWYKDGSTPNWVSDWGTKFAAANYASLISGLPSADRHVVSWSDHDFGYANNSTGSDNATLTANANSAYRTKFGSSGTGVQGQTLPSSGIYRSWVHGRVRFILLDMLTFKSTLGTTSSSSRTMLGATQKAWYKNLLANSTEPLLVVLGDGQIPGAAADGQDEWRGYSAERSELASALAASPATVLYLNGDTHSLAYGHDQYGYARCWQSAPLHNATKVKAGGEGYIQTYPTNANEGATLELYAVVTFTDDGSSITATYRGYEGSTVRLTDSITVTG